MSKSQHQQKEQPRIGGREWGRVTESSKDPVEFFSTVKMESKTMGRICMYTHTVKELAARKLHNKD